MRAAGRIGGRVGPFLVFFGAIYACVQGRLRFEPAIHCNGRQRDFPFHYACDSIG